jgi:hypothetical protein
LAVATTEFEEDADNAPPREVLSVSPAAVTTEVEEDIDDGAPWEVLPESLAVVTIEVEEDIDGRPLGGAALVLYHGM